jgi:cysteine synthase A
MSTRYESILATIGNTPVIRINRLAPEGVNLFVKVESFNPLSSVKDRLALGVIEAAEQSGALKPGQTVVEATSGNTGIGLAMVCAAKGYPFVCVMAESFSVERRKIMRFLGAKVVLTPAAQKGSGMINKAKELGEKHGWFETRQFENEANAAMHSRTTGPEIVAAFADTKLDYWVTGFGTGGTLKGVGRVLKKESPATKIILCEPDTAQLIASGVAQERFDDGSPAASHPSFSPHPMQGWSPDFIPLLTEEAMGLELADKVLPINGKAALAAAHNLARQEGIFAGISSGATLAGALQICDEAPAGSNILAMLPDTGERYLSTPLFDDIEVDMDADELAISRSTANYQFD